MTDRELMQQALDALENSQCNVRLPAYVMRHNAVITALRERLAQPDRAERMRDAGYTRRPPTLREFPRDSDDSEQTWNVPHASTIRCLYAAIDRIRAGDEPAEIFRDFGWQFDADAQTVECVCAEPTAPGVIHRTDGPCYMAEAADWEEEARRYALNADFWRRKYEANTAPPQRKPLTDEQINRIMLTHISITEQHLHDAVWMIIRDVESAHGIEEQP